jgi:uncharacterized membrane protein YphA (DoxX/SURF4 family)
VYTGTNKLIEYRDFRTVLHQDPQIAPIANYLTWWLPISELAIALFLFVPKTRRIGFWLSLFTMTTFTVYIGYKLYFSSALPCTCGGVLKQMTWKQHLIFNIVFTLLAALGLWLDRKKSNALHSQPALAV